ncbi:MAG: hypothetical protein ACXW1S_08925 [Acidimicrobiia bacterium]
MTKVAVTPNPFVLVEYDSGALSALTERVAGRVGVPDDVDIAIEVDEALPRPLIASYVDAIDVGDGVRGISIWCSGGNFEHPQYPRRFDDAGAEVKLATDLRRAADRLSPGFADAPPDSELTERQREAWDASAAGRVSRLGFAVREPLTRYHFRLSNGFGDAVDAVYERLWGADELTWADLEAACAETAAADERPTPKARPGAVGASLRR